MSAPYRIVDLNSFSGPPTGNEIIELSQGGNGSYQTPLSTISYGPRQPVTIATAATYNLASSTYGDILVNTSGAVVVNLPSSLTRNGAPASVVDIDGAPNITINPAAGQTIIGQSSISLTVPYGGYTFWPIGTGSGGWYQK
jgi:hypothetical protein